MSRNHPLLLAAAPLPFRSGFSLPGPLSIDPRSPCVGFDAIDIVKERVRVQRWRQRMEEDQPMRCQRKEEHNPLI